MWDGIFLSALACIQREKDNLGPVNSQSKVRYKNQKVPMTALKQTSYFWKIKNEIWLCELLN